MFIDNIIRACNSVCDRRNDYGHDAGTYGAEQPCNGQHYTALIGVGRHRSRQTPIRNVDCRIRHGPEHVEYRNYRNGLPTVDCVAERHTPKLIRQEAHYRKNCYRDCRKKHVRSTLTPFAVRMVDYRTHYRVVERVIQTGAEHNKTDCGRCYHQTVGQIVSQVGAYDCRNKVLSETAERIAYRFAGLHALFVVRVGHEHLM